jgi:PTS system beta-glucosides-specific IIC component
MIIDVFSPFLVMGCMHYALVPIGAMNIASPGFGTLIGPGMLGSNIARGGADGRAENEKRRSEIARFIRKGYCALRHHQTGYVRRYTQA